MSEKIVVNESELKELVELYKNIEEKKRKKKRRRKSKKTRKKRSIPSKDRKNPRQYSAPQGSKRDKGLDKAAELYAKGDIKGAARIRDRMEKAARKEPGYKNKPRKDTGMYTEEKDNNIISESIIKNQFLSEEFKVNNPEAFLSDRIEEIKLDKVLEEYENFLDEKKKRKKKKKRSSKGLSAAVKKSLDKKADRRCLTRGSVYAEFRKGLAAYLSSGSRKGMTAHQWAHARVNSANPSKSWAVVKKRKKCPTKKKKKK